MDPGGGEFVPQVFSGESFRAKFERLEAACQRDITSIEVTPEAAAVAGRLAGLGWPAGSAGAVPGAAQASLDAYAAFLAANRGFVERLRRDDLAKDYGAERARLLKFGEHIADKLPAPGHFVETWLRAVHARVHGWDGWSGELAPYIFKPEAKRFLAMGRGWAEAYAGDPDRWDRYLEVMRHENQ